MNYKFELLTKWFADVPDLPAPGQLNRSETFLNDRTNEELSIVCSTENEVGSMYYELHLTIIRKKGGI